MPVDRRCCLLGLHGGRVGRAGREEALAETLALKSLAERQLVHALRGSDIRFERPAARQCRHARPVWLPRTETAAGALGEMAVGELNSLRDALPEHGLAALEAGSE